ncbi:MAG: hypothetical protein KDE00_09080 [Rhodobacteraceae bacterium]|nr:hypothetical protein [Paracoccaceae bacterium]
MIRRLMPPALFVLAACTGGPVQNVASVTLDGATYPVEAGASGWSVIVDGNRLACRAATEADCLWAVRHYRTSQDALDSLG